jgi:oligopeptide/dipeptide ABC transporter ATP-binding protein
VMYASEVVEQGPVAEVLAQPRHPYTRALLDCTPHGGSHRRRLQPIPGGLPSPLAQPAGCRFHPRCHFVADRCKLTEPALEVTAHDHVTRCMRWREISL